ncbi:carbohydrate binding domain-containing protein [Paenibacillus sp. FSL F4-0125]|uniref:carbohydrate binding domain-containing protein n=1 Tax=Paenibacillus sp. FSL F4-0125 TaxID=2954730 RepID=UPI004046F43F
MTPTPTPTVTPTPTATPTGNTATIYYKNTAYSSSYIHYKLDGATVWTTAPGEQLQASSFPGYKSITIQLGTAAGLTAAFNNGSGTWDNNGSSNYHFAAGTWSLVNGSISAGEPQADSVTFRVNVPASTPASGPVYLTGTFNSWNAADPAYQLTKGSDGVYSITLSLPAGTAVQYKFTRGAWTNVEVNSNGSDISNRALTPAGGAQTVNLTVQRWKDL